MPKEFSLFYRGYVGDYVVSQRGDLRYDSGTDRTFPDFEKALRYLVENYGERKSQLSVDDHCRDNYGSELGRKLNYSRIALKGKKK